MQTILLNKRGFSITELIVVIAIIGILSAVAITSTRYLRQERVTSCTRQLFADIQNARYQAMTSANVTSSITFSTANTNQYTVLGITKTFASGLQINVTPGSYPLTMTFDHMGFPRDSSGNLLSSNSFISVNNVSDPGYAKCINIGTAAVREGYMNGTNCQTQ